MEDSGDEDRRSTCMHTFVRIRITGKVHVSQAFSSPI